MNGMRAHQLVVERSQRVQNEIEALFPLILLRDDIVAADFFERSEEIESFEGRTGIESRRRLQHQLAKILVMNSRIDNLGEKASEEEGRDGGFDSSVIGIVGIVDRGGGTS